MAWALTWPIKGPLFLRSSKNGHSFPAAGGLGKSQNSKKMSKVIDIGQSSMVYLNAL
jgi:hypothetical protein